MTLEEAKKKIEELGNDAWNKWRKEGNLISQGYALGMDDALGIVDKLDTEPVGNSDKLNLDNVIRNLESDEAVCRSHSEDDYFKGIAEGYKLSIDALKGLSGNLDKLTLKELAHELRKIFKFKYLTASLNTRIHLWSGRAPIYRINGKYWTSDFIKTSVLGELMGMELVNVLDLSEYKDENGNIDYSKCIVEVSDETE